MHDDCGDGSCGFWLGFRLRLGLGFRLAAGGELQGQSLGADERRLSYKVTTSVCSGSSSSSRRETLPLLSQYLNFQFQVREQERGTSFT